MLATVEDGPCDAAGVLALEEQGLRLAVLEAEDLAVATDIDLTLKTNNPSALNLVPNCSSPSPNAVSLRTHQALSQVHPTKFRDRIGRGEQRQERAYLAGVDPLAGEAVVVGSHLVAFGCVMATSGGVECGP